MLTRVFSSMVALLSNKSCTMLVLPQREATWSGVILFCNMYYNTA